MSKSSLSRIVALDKWESVQNAISKVSGIPLVTMDRNGEPLTRVSGDSEYCDAMRHSTSKRRKCVAFKNGVCNETIRAAEPRLFSCSCGLVEAVIPLMDKTDCCGLISLGMVRLKDGEKAQPVLNREIAACASGCGDAATADVPEVEYDRLMDTVQLVRTTFDMLQTVHRSAVKRATGAHKTGKEPERQDVSKESPVYSAVKYFDNRLDEQISMKRMAQLCQLSESYFSKVFLRETGMNYVDWANDRKMKWAKHYIETSEASIRDIAASLGFSDTSYFIKVFKKYCGVTPLTYRRTVTKSDT